MVIPESAQTSEKLYTAEDFWEFADLPENDGKRFELIDGMIVEIAESRPINTIIAGRIIYFLNALVIPNNLGYITVPDGGFKLAPDQTRQPDAAFVAKTRVPVIPARFELAPDLAVEVVSEREDVLKKAQEYFSAGTQIVWAVYPDDKQVYVIKPDSERNLDDTLDGGDVLSGFTLKVKDIFPE